MNFYYSILLTMIKWIRNTIVLSLFISLQLPFYILEICKVYLVYGLQLKIVGSILNRINQLDTDEIIAVEQAFRNKIKN